MEDTPPSSLSRQQSIQIWPPALGARPETRYSCPVLTRALSDRDRGPHPSSSSSESPNRRQERSSQMPSQIDEVPDAGTTRSPIGLSHGTSLPRAWPLTSVASAWSPAAI